MSSEWYTTTIGEFCPFKYGKSLPERDREAGSVPVLSSAGFVGFHNKPLVNASGIVVGRKGTVGSVTFSPTPFWAIDTAFYIEDVPAQRDIKYTYYLLRTLGLEGMNSDSAVPGLNRDNAHALEINVPTLVAQKQIASFLGTLDDRITLLRETNATLEAMAQALFKSWFVDFDPVHANLRRSGAAPSSPSEFIGDPAVDESLDSRLRGNDGLLPAELSALFPNRFTESPLGMVPEGWRIGTIGEEITVTDYVANGSFAALKENVTLHNFPSYALYLRTTDYNSGFSGDFRYVDKSAYDFLSKSSLDGTEVVISNVGDVGTVFRPPRWLGLPMTLGSNAVALKKREMSSYLYFHFSGPAGQHAIQSIVTGSAQLKFNKTNFRALKLLIPSSQCLAAFEVIADSLLTRIDTNLAQAQTLATLRDTLLPRLISGQLRLPEAMELVDGM